MFLTKEIAFTTMTTKNKNYSLTTMLLIFLIIGVSSCRDAPSTTENHSSKDSTRQPNIIVIIPDDMGWSDIGYNGSAIKTPHLDRLAKKGKKLNHNYVMATCTPTRVGLFTGQYASNFGVTAPAYGEVIPEGTATMASELDKQGYFTALVGKWHMGSPPYIPVKYGFKTAYGYLDGQIDPYTHNYKKAYPHHSQEEDTSYVTDQSWNGEGEYLTNELSKKEVDTNLSFSNFKFLHQKGHATDLITEQAIRLIKEKKEHPFFIYLAYSAPHFPLEEPDKWLSMYKDTFAYSSRRRFAASVTHMDDGIGKVVAALKETHQRENTIILFMSDNGAQKSWPKAVRERLYNGKYKDVSHNVLGNNYPLRGWKDELYEGGIRTPAFINWPGHLKPGEINIPTKWTDWFPTFLSLAGSSREEIQHLHLDGDNLWPVLTGKSASVEDTDRAFFWETPHSYAVRKGDWKLLVHKKTQQAELYNIKEDFREIHELSQQNQEKVQELQKLLAQFKSRNE